ncbi:hypothetical protein GQX73_g4054 [Xylaria multiplex]|uniref:Uncharacterized protein n=1 Tax=Xylaria multiplex TaxID=323545 RepID=A0A7C8MVC2_9PEZI|nr:hypothetical protein GQX73_g4054 [Xylaria multiplex]
MSAFDFETDAEGSTTTVSSWSTSVTLTKNWVHAYGPIVHAMADNTLSVIPTPGSSPTASLSDYEGRKATVTVTMIPGEGPGTDTTAGLSTEAAAVVGVGSVIIVMLSIAAAVFLCRRRRKGLKRNWGVGWVAPTQAPHIPEQEYETQHRRQHALELSTERHQRFPYELEAERGV